jgi:hypothetical protein
MLLDKFSKLIALVTEARTIVNDLLWNKEPAPAVKHVYLLGMLAQIQSILVSMRAQVLEKMVSGHSPPAPPRADPEERFLEKLSFYRRALSAPRRANVIAFERRRNAADRRVLPTYLARDRRSGIADRRRKRPAPPPAMGGRDARGRR